jgi:hypothetical protein
MPKLPLSSKRREDRIAQRLLAKKGQFPSLFYEAKRICLHLLKVEEAVENFKNAQWFFSCFCFFPTIPLLAKLKLVRQSL